MKGSFLFFRHFNDQSAKIKYEKRFVVDDSVEFRIYQKSRS